MVADKENDSNEKSFFTCSAFRFLHIIPGWHFNTWQKHATSYHCCGDQYPAWICVLYAQFTSGSQA